ncbi:hypothetical protein FACS1894200_03760 [Spirochaetia bacterium]|nr:hypothetical protein FACS1894200_03760 [Spirochaetia bacterium]
MNEQIDEHSKKKPLKKDDSFENSCKMLSAFLENRNPPDCITKFHKALLEIKNKRDPKIIAIVEHLKIFNKLILNDECKNSFFLFFQTDYPTAYTNWNPDERKQISKSIYDFLKYLVEKKKAAKLSDENELRLNDILKNLESKDQGLLFVQESEPSAENTPQELNPIEKAEKFETIDSSISQPSLKEPEQEEAVSDQPCETKENEATGKLKKEKEALRKALEEKKEAIDKLKKANEVLREEKEALSEKLKKEKETRREANETIAKLEKEKEAQREEIINLTLPQFPLHFEKVCKEAGLAVDEGSHHPTYTFEKGFITLTVSKEKKSAVISDYEVKELKRLLAYIPDIINVIKNEQERLFQRLFNSKEFLEKLRKYYLEIIAEEHKPDGSGIPIRQITARMKENTKGFQLDEFNVDLSKLAFLRDNLVTDDGRKLDTQQSKDTEEGMLLYGASRGYINRVLFKEIEGEIK